MAAPAVVLDTADGASLFFGTLASKAERSASIATAGVNVATLGVDWSRFEPTAPGAIDPKYMASLIKDLGEWRAAGVQVVLDPGVHYQPKWLWEAEFSGPHGRYVNQFGDEYIDPSPGKNIANAIFNAKVRAQQARYIGALMTALGNGTATAAPLHAVRLGWGWWGETNYPDNKFKRANGTSNSNCYWGYDALAQGTADGRVSSIPACPVPGWKPGQPSPNGEAEKFSEWYLDALKDYVLWQAATVRPLFAGPLLQLLPSWGVRPNQLAAAVKGNLDGKTSTEINGELPRGFDWPRIVPALAAGVVPYTTWMDPIGPYVNDSSPVPAMWSPPHWLSSLAAPGVRVWGENTGHNTAASLAVRRPAPNVLPAVSHES